MGRSLQNSSSYARLNNLIGATMALRSKADIERSIMESVARTRKVREAIVRDKEVRRQAESEVTRSPIELSRVPPSSLTKP